MVDFIHVMQDILSLLLMKTVLFSLDTSILTVHRLDVLHLMNFFVHYYDEITHSIPSPPKNYEIVQLHHIFWPQNLLKEEITDSTPMPFFQTTAS